VLLVTAMSAALTFCLAIIDNGRLSIDLLALTLQVVCYYNQLTVAKIVVERYRSLLNFQHLYDALLQASVARSQ
jgi:hypothetical protein